MAPSALPGTGARAALARALVDLSALDALVARHGAERVLSRAVREGIGALVAAARPDVPAFGAWRRRAMLIAELQREDMVRVGDALAASGAQALVFKGAALAQDVYPEPWMRPRRDLDLLILDGAGAPVRRALDAAGYRRWAPRMASDAIFQQDPYVRRVGGDELVVDVHQQVTNRVFFHRLTPASLFARARPAPFAGAGALQPSRADSLILASVHRAAHHSSGVPLIWLYDVWLLARGLDHAGLADYASRAATLGVASLAARDLAEARRLFGGATAALSEDVVGELMRRGAREPARRFLAPRGRLRDLWLDLAALDTWAGRARFFGACVCPPADYMRGADAAGASRWLPWRYARRFSIGAAQWIAESRRHDLTDSSF